VPVDNVLRRLGGIRKQLMASYEASAPMSAATKGRERETFVDGFLKDVFPPIYRFGSGDVVDLEGNQSGQIDVVVEFPLGPSLPAVGSPHHRLYLAETVAATLEIKSDIQAQWKEVIHTANSLSKIKRSSPSGLIIGSRPSPRIPFIAIGFKGWSRADIVRQKLVDNSAIDAILIVEHGIFATSSEFGSLAEVGEQSVWLAISLLYEFTGRLIYSTFNGANYAATPKVADALSPPHRSGDQILLTM